MKLYENPLGNTFLQYGICRTVNLQKKVLSADVKGTHILILTNLKGNNMISSVHVWSPSLVPTQVASLSPRKMEPMDMKVHIQEVGVKRLMML